jgi:hypothetical protein
VATQGCVSVSSDNGFSSAAITVDDGDVGGRDIKRTMPLESRALSWRSFETAVDVAGRALNAQMCAREGIPSRGDRIPARRVLGVTRRRGKDRTSQAKEQSYDR